jgi:hypothetical protein
MLIVLSVDKLCDDSLLELFAFRKKNGSPKIKHAGAEKADIRTRAGRGI